MDHLLRCQKFYLQVITILLGLGVLRLWLAPVEILPAAAAQGMPDSGAQRERQIAEAVRTNHILERIEALVRDGVLRVRIEEQWAPQAPAPPEKQRKRP